MPTQLDLFSAVQDIYLENGGELRQHELYKHLASKTGINPSEHIGHVGETQSKHNLFHRKVRWVQQSLKSKRLLEQVDRGTWRLAGSAAQRLHVIETGKSVIAASTNLGIVICSDSQSVFDNKLVTEPINLVVTSPPYMLQKPRLYGGTFDEESWVDFICEVISKIQPRLAEGANICLNIGQDAFNSNEPSRLTHIELLTTRLVYELKLKLVDRLIWQSNKAPAPYQYCSKHHFMLHTGYEFCLVFCNSPWHSHADNRRVRQPHSDAHTRYVQRGGASRKSVSGDGAYRKRVGAYSNTDLSKGRIPNNILQFSNKCVQNEMVNRYARSLQIPTHGAKFPISLAKYLVQYLSRPGDFCYDPFGGTATFGQACQILGRPFMITEPVFEYVRQSFVRFENLGDDVYYNPYFLKPHLLAA
ncbi:DNA methyltransferase [Enterovibrio norvegicus]|uniref:DNA methyltransferase n=1 Tax=Enterovibrio norvegicus TaxID=188144 RepID=UPI00352D5AE2